MFSEHPCIHKSRLFYGKLCEISSFLERSKIFINIPTWRESLISEHYLTREISSGFSFTRDQLGKLEGVHWLRISTNLFDNNFFAFKWRQKILKTHFRLKWDPKSLSYVMCVTTSQLWEVLLYFVLFIFGKLSHKNAYFYFWPNDLIHLLLFTFVRCTFPSMWVDWII